LNLQSNKSLQAYNTFGINATARYFVDVNSETDFLHLIDSPSFKQHKHYIIGGGSNILLTKDFDGIIIHNQIKGIDKVAESDEQVWLTFGAGEVWHTCVLHCIKNNFAGIENLSLIPGYIGAAPMQNIGAYGVELKDVFSHLTAIHIQTGQSHTFYNDDCAFGYRESVFKNKYKADYLITSVTLRLNKTPNFNISYGAIEKTLEENNISELNIKAVSDAVIQIRQSKLPDPKVIGNAGSFFKNPVVENSHAESIKTKNENMPSYPAGHKTKIPAGWLIDQCGYKGKVIGNTGTYKNQALVLVNRGGASGNEVFNLSEEIKQTVLAEFGIELEREVNLVG